MYFNDEKNNTSLDKELSDKTIMTKLKENLKKIIIGIILLLLLIIAIIFIVRMFKNRITFKLNGDNPIELSVGETFVDPGYIATDRKGTDISNDVQIVGNVDTTQKGTYKITYTLRNKKLTRVVNVGETIINLDGQEIIYLKLNEKYTEPGYTCIDSIDGDITDKVKVTNDIDSSKKGAYKVIYEVTNSKNITTTKSRVIIIE